MWCRRIPRFWRTVAGKRLRKSGRHSSFLGLSTAAAAGTAPGRGFRGIDHVCVVVRDIDRSIDWYKSVLGLRHVFADDPCFGKDPAFLQCADRTVNVALLPLQLGQDPVRDHRGAHFAIGVGMERFLDEAESLPAVLAENRLDGETHSVEVDRQDYGLQQSLFFSDPDRNIVELTFWGSADQLVK